MSRLGTHRSQSTDPEPFKRDVLFSVRDVLSGLVSFLPSCCCLLNLIWPQCNRPPCSSFQLHSLQIVLSLPVHAFVCVRVLNTVFVSQNTELHLGKHLQVRVYLYLGAYTHSSAYVHFNLKSRLVAMETPVNVALVGNNGLYCTLYFIVLKTSRQHLSTLQHIWWTLGGLCSYSHPL